MALTILYTKYLFFLLTQASNSIISFIPAAEAKQRLYSSKMQIPLAKVINQLSISPHEWLSQETPTTFLPFQYIHPSLGVHSSGWHAHAVVRDPSAACISSAYTPFHILCRLGTSLYPAPIIGPHESDIPQDKVYTPLLTWGVLADLLKGKLWRLGPWSVGSRICSQHLPWCRVHRAVQKLYVLINKLTQLFLHTFIT